MIFSRGADSKLFVSTISEVPISVQLMSEPGQGPLRARSRLLVAGSNNLENAGIRDKSVSLIFLELQILNSFISTLSEVPISVLLKSGPSPDPLRAWPRLFVYDNINLKNAGMIELSNSLMFLMV